jgi:hypothetical protein
MSFDEFQLEVCDGSHIIVDGREHVVLLSQPGLVIARPEGSPLSWSLAQATVDVVQITDITWCAWEIEIC